MTTRDEAYFVCDANPCGDSSKVRGYSLQKSCCYFSSGRVITVLGLEAVLVFYTIDPHNESPSSPSRLDFDNAMLS
jgi:hypothetical protein